MLSPPRIPELRQRDRFVRRAVEGGHVFVLPGDAGIMPSRRQRGRQISLVWSIEADARRWAEGLTGAAVVQSLTLQDFAARRLAADQSTAVLAGPDWLPDPVEPEIEPADLQYRLSAEAAFGMLDDIAAAGEVYTIIRDGALDVAAGVPRQGKALRLFRSAADGHRALAAIPGVALGVYSAREFSATVLPWLADQGYRLALEPIEGAGLIDIAAPKSLRDGRAR